MKRRNFLKWLPVIPIGIQSLRNKAKEEPKVEAPKPPAPQPEVRRTLQPQSGQNLTSCSFTLDLPADMYPGQAGWLFNGKDWVK